jgi:outer membrane protein assembly factor BamE (lipoprotein component of BamABCDE complex)
MKSPRPHARSLAIALLSTAIAVPATLIASPAAAARIDVYARAQVRNAEAFAAIAPGMTERQVLERLGEPDHRLRFGISRATSWDYSFRDAWGYDAEFSVTFGEDGVVRSTFTGRHDA